MILFAWTRLFRVTTVSLVLVGFGSPRVYAQAKVLTYHNDSSRSGQNLNEDSAYSSGSANATSVLPAAMSTCWRPSSMYVIEAAPQMDDPVG